jgi:hypothetical protein
LRLDLLDKELTPREQARKLRRALDELADGRTPDDIADYLHKQRISGVPGNPRVCPVATYLLLRGAPQGIAVLTESTSWRVSKTFTVSVRHPQEIQEFIENFDHGRYLSITLQTTRQQDCQLVG